MARVSVPLQLEGDPREPPHVHVAKAGADAKFWLRPEVTLAYNPGHNAKVLAELIQQVEAHRDEIEDAWNQHFA